MVMPIVEPVFAGILVSLINKYLLSGSCTERLRQSCDAKEQEQEAEEFVEEHSVSSTTTTISDATVHVHSH